MAFRRVIYTSDSKLDIIKQDINRLMDTKTFQIYFPKSKCEITIRTSAKPNTLVVDINGEGADSVAKKLKDLGNKNDVPAKIKTNIKLAPVKESNIMKKSELKTMIKEEIFKTLG